ncbi:MAG: DUF1799 domain-containing protein [Ottowia sp.]|uniref:DUF1799 domain-containing protein n=1 Tax=Ottowia sp. TaxID=1898956 RepID=UPI003C75B174
MAAARYKRPPTAQQLAAIGMRPSDLDDEVIEIWPENMPAFLLWSRIGDQWRMGFGGPESLDFGPLFHELDRMELSTQDYEDLFEDIREMAQAALAEMRRQAD